MGQGEYKAQHCVGRCENFQAPIGIFRNRVFFFLKGFDNISSELQLQTGSMTTFLGARDATRNDGETWETPCRLVINDNNLS